MFYKKKNRQLIDFDEFTFKYHQAFGVEKPLENRNFIIIISLFFLIVLVAILRIGYFSLIKNKYYSNLASANVNRIIVVGAERGLIKDRYGVPIVKNESVLSLYLSLKEVHENNELELVYEAIAKLGITKEDLDQLIENSKNRDDVILIKKDITNLEAIAIKGSNIQSLLINNDFKRTFGEEFAHIVGYTGFPSKEEINAKKLHSVDFVGKSNLELYFDDDLRGENGKIISYRNSKGEELGQHSFSNPKKGNDLETTIDADLTSFAFHRLQKNFENGSGPGGAVIIMSPSSGEVLSLVSLPSFSSNTIFSGINDKNKPLFNRAISGLYSPGSIIKTIVGVATLKEGVMKKEDEVLSTGQLLIPNKYNPKNPTKFVDWRPHGWVNLRSALAKSSNIYFYAAGGGLVQNPHLFKGWGGVVKGLGVERLTNYYKLFRLGEKTGIQLSSEAEGYIPSVTDKKKRTGIDWTIGDTYISSIGQGDVVVSPIALLSAVSSIYNQGKIMKPLLIPAPPVVLKDNSYLKPEMDEVLSGMHDVTKEKYGTAYLMASLPFDVFGKTGSAQIMNNKKINAFFVGCTNFTKDKKIGDDLHTLSPKDLCVLVLVENAKEGSMNAVPVAKDILEWYYKKRVTQ